MKNPVKVGLLSLGCPKNTVDSEIMLGHLRAGGMEITADPDAAEVLVVNTCGFIEAAREESIHAILEAARRKSEGSCRRLVVTGCMVHRYRDELAAEIPEIDALVDLDGLAGIRAAVGLEAASGAHRAAGTDGPGAMDGTPAGDGAASRAPLGLPMLHGGGTTAATLAASLPPSTYLYGAATPRLRTTPPWMAYVKIAEGCDNTCAFCAIPRFRGAFRSRPLDDILVEARRLAAEGVAELNLVAQDSTAYGADLGLSGGPARLLDALSRVDGLRWVRLFYVYPNKVGDDLLEVMGSRPRVARYIDIPLQHASRDVLARMRRGGSAESHLRLLARIRRSVPGVAIRTTFIVGFPGETEADIRLLEEFIAEARFENLGIFTYSHEESTAAFHLPDDVPAAMKEERKERLMARQEMISARLNQSRVGRTEMVLCEGACSETEHLLQGRLEGQAPEVDGRVLINDGEAAPGRFVQVEITEAHPYDLIGRAVGPA